MEIPSIKIPEGIKFLSEYLTELPKNCLFNKAVTGCGGTSVALRNDHPAIICVPYLAMIENKVDQAATDKHFYPHPVFGFHGKTASWELEWYLYELPERCVPKIMVTYNSLERLISDDCIDPLNYTLLVDEYHCLFTEYRSRTDAVKSVLRSYQRFKSFTFMTATPIDRWCLMKELRDVPICNAEWERPKLPHIAQLVCKSSLRKAVSLRIRSILRNDTRGNHYFFVNSVEFIASMIESCQLTSDVCRVIYSESNKTILPIEHGKAGSLPKKINLITKTAFEGVDFRDPLGRIYVVSDVNSKLSVIDISTQLQQIAGRIRDRDEDDWIYHMYSTTIVSKAKSQKAILAECYLERDQEIAMADAINSLLDTKSKLRLAKPREKWKYHLLDEVTGNVQLDENLVNLELYLLNIMHSVYQTPENVAKEYNRNKLVSTKPYYSIPNPDLLTKANPSFAELVKELECLWEANSDSNDPKSEYSVFLKEATIHVPIIPDAIQEFGFDEIRNRKYRVTDIKRSLEARMPKVLNGEQLEQVQKLLLSKHVFDYPESLPDNYLRKIMRESYNELGIQGKPSGPEIQHFFEAISHNSKLDGKKQRYHTISGPKQL